MTQHGRRILFDSVTGSIIVDFGEVYACSDGSSIRPTINAIDYVDLEYGYEKENFNKVKKYHIDPTTKKVVFDEFYQLCLSQEQQIEKLQQELLQSQGVI